MQRPILFLALLAGLLVTGFLLLLPPKVPVTAQGGLPNRDGGESETSGSPSADMLPFDRPEPSAVSRAPVATPELGMPRALLDRGSEVVVTLVGRSTRLEGWRVEEAVDGTLWFPDGAFSDRQGKVRLQSRASRTRRIRVVAPTNAWSSAHVVTFPIEGERREVRLELQGADPSGVIKFEIVDAHNGDRLEGVGATLILPSEDRRKSRSDAVGTVRLPFVEKASYVFALSGYSTRRLELEEAVGSQRVTLRRRATVTGTAAAPAMGMGRGKASLVLKRPGKSAPGERVIFSSEVRGLESNARWEAKIDRDGGWCIESIDVPYDLDFLELVGVRLEGMGVTRTIPAEGVVEPGGSVHVADPWISAPERAVKVELDEAASIPMGGEIVLRDPETGTEVFARPDRDGVCHFGPLPAGPWKLQVGLARVPSLSLEIGTTSVRLRDHGVVEVTVPEEVRYRSASWTVRASSGETSRLFSATSGRPVALYGIPNNSRVGLELFRGRRQLDREWSALRRADPVAEAEILFRGQPVRWRFPALEVSTESGPGSR